MCTTTLDSAPVFFESKFYFYVCVYVCMSVCDHTHMHIVISKGQKRVSDVLGLEGMNSSSLPEYEVPLTAETSP